MDTPPSSIVSRRGSLESLDEMDDYFANYVPLSSLPTPPEPTHCKEDTLQRKTSYDTTHLRPQLQGPAIHLANLVPSGVCLHRPSPSIIQTYLEHFTLPLETLALAGCVLDSLSLRFSRKLRESFASASVEVPSGPEVIVLAALALATSYHLDEHLRASHWTNIVALGTVTTQQFNIASRCVLVDIDYSLHSFTPAMVEETLQDMQRAGTSSGLGLDDDDDVCYFTAPHAKSSDFPSIGHGNAVEANGLMTPEPTPA